MANKIYPCPICFMPVLRGMFQKRDWLETRVECLRDPKEFAHYDCWLERKLSTKNLGNVVSL